MKIDLHCHTKKIKSGEALTRNVTKELFVQKVVDADVGIIAITNHNSFDLEQFSNFSACVQSYCQIWPGVEFDIKDVSKKRWHLIIVANPKNVKAFNRVIHSLVDGKNQDSITFTMQQVVDAVKGLDVLYIPHYHKSPAISEEDWSILVSLIPETYRIFQETPDQRTLDVFANYQNHVIIGSDVTDWNKYEESTFAELRLPVQSFEQFELLAKRDNVIVQTLLGKKQVYHVIASPHPNVKFPLTIYQEMNVIFGPKGTGKSEILKSINIELQGQGLKCVNYKGADRDTEFKRFLSLADMTRDLSILHSENGEKALNQILEWTDSSPTLFTNYISWYETQEKNKNKDRMKITNATVLPPNPSKEFEVSKNDWKSIKLIEEQYGKIHIECYLDYDERIKFETILNKLLMRTKKKAISEFINIKATELANFSIEKIKQIADKNTDTKSFPSTTGFRNFAISRIKLKENINKCIKILEAEPVSKKKYLGTLEDKGKIYISSNYRMICKDSVSDEFDIGIRTLTPIWRKIISLSDNVFHSKITQEISELHSLCTENNIKNLLPFLGRSKTPVTENGEPYEPSNGEKGILLMQKKLDEDGDAYLIDEPELGMGSSYIEKCIRPKLSDLAKQQKIVIVVTHNANIAIRTLPYQSIFRDHKDGIFRTYIGNPFTNRLINTEDPSEVLSWKDESMHTLEGGPEAFYEREYIYESGSHQC